MAKLLGNNYRLFVQSAVPGTFNQPAGQGNLTINRNQGFFDTSTKDTGAYGTQAPSQKTLTVTQAIMPDLPDANGFTLMESLDAGTETEVYQIRRAPFDDEDDVVFECLMYTSVGNTDLNQNAPVGVAITLSAAEAPTIDELK